jgi:hypothetical protein
MWPLTHFRSAHVATGGHREADYNSQAWQPVVRPGRADVAREWTDVGFEQFEAESDGLSMTTPGV